MTPTWMKQHIGIAHFALSAGLYPYSDEVVSICDPGVTSMGWHPAPYDIKRCKGCTNRLEESLVLPSTPVRIKAFLDVIVDPGDVSEFERRLGIWVARQQVMFDKTGADPILRLDIADYEVAGDEDQTE